MTGVNSISTLLKIADFSDITNEDISLSLEEKQCTAGNEVYCLFGDNNFVDYKDKTDLEIKNYILSIIKKIEDVIGTKYSVDFKNAFVDYFIIESKIDTYDITEKIPTLESFVNKYKFDLNTCGWYIVERIKRKLMISYTFDKKNISKLKKLIEDIKSTNDKFVEFSKNI